MPAMLLTSAGLLTALTGLMLFVIGIWPAINNPGPMNILGIEDLIAIGLGSFFFVWGALVCYGADRMHSVASYRWSLIAAVLAIVPCMVGLYALFVLTKPDLIAGFIQTESESTD
jgi:hypothetical protein